jgi:hypothetical protein
LCLSVTDFPCTSRTITVSHLTFDNAVTFTDMTTVAYQGIVSIAGTSTFNDANACPISGATVCANNHYGANEQIVCRETDSNGMLDHNVCSLIVVLTFRVLCHQLATYMPPNNQACTHCLFRVA